MKAVVYKSPDEPIVVEDRPEPTPGSGEMVLKVARCGICGSDAALTTCHGFIEPDSILGHEYSGEVIAIGRDVEGFKLGDSVTAMPMAGCGACEACRSGNPLLCRVSLTLYSGGFAAYTPVAARSAIKLPRDLSLVDGALVEPMAVGLHGLQMAQLQAGARVLVIGAGAVGLSAIFWARRLGAGKIATVARTNRRAELAGVMGADMFATIGEDAAERVNASLGGPPDLVVEAVGSVGALEQAAGFVRSGGTVLSLGFCAAADGINPAIASLRQLRFVFSMGYSLENFQRSADMLASGSAEPRHLIGTTIGLSEVPAAIDAIRDGVAEHARVLVNPDLG